MTEYLAIDMVGGQAGSVSFLVPQQYVTADGFEYYGWATDGVNEAYFPADWQTSPASFPPVADLPVIEHTAPGEYRADKNVDLTALVTAPYGVTGVKVYYRMAGEDEYNVLTMTLEGSEYAVSIPKDHIGKGEMEYYVVATNSKGFNGYKGSPDEPLTLDVKAKKDDSPAFGLAVAMLALVASSAVVVRWKR